MKIVKTIKDLEQLKKKRLLSIPLLKHLQEYLLELKQSLEPNCRLKDFTLEDYGYFVVLEAGDDVRNLEEVGLNPEDEGILGSCPEWVEQKVLDDGCWIYQIAVLYNNETMMMFTVYLKPLMMKWKAGSRKQQELIKPQSLKMRLGYFYVGRLPRQRFILGKK